MDAPTTRSLGPSAPDPLFSDRLAETKEQASITVPAVAADLQRMADNACDPNIKAALLRASRALFQQPGGRRPTNDRRRLQDAQHLLAMGLAKSENDALAKVAGTIATDYQSLKTIIERLRRKRRKSSLKIIKWESAKRTVSFVGNKGNRK